MGPPLQKINYLYDRSLVSGVSMKRRKIDPETRMAAVVEGLRGERSMKYKQFNQEENLGKALWLPGSRLGRIPAFTATWNAAFITLNRRQMITFEV